jgi:hypothetical protein
MCFVHNRPQQNDKENGRLSKTIKIKDKIISTGLKGELEEDLTEKGKKK